MALSLNVANENMVNGDVINEGDKIVHYHRRINHAPADGDFIIRVVEKCPELYNEEVINNIFTTDFVVRLDRITGASRILANAAQRYLERYARPGSIFTIHGDSGIALEVWFAVIHETFVPDYLYWMPLGELWNIITTGRKYNIFNGHFIKIMPWFDKWYENTYSQANLDHESAQLLVLPTYLFGHAQGFMKATRWLAYQGPRDIQKTDIATPMDQATERRVITDPLINTKDWLESLINREIWFISQSLMASDCICKKETLYNVQEALFKVSLWPNVQPKCESIHFHLRALGTVSYTPRTDTLCVLCSTDFGAAFQKTSQTIAENFDGLCLDCIERSQLERTRSLEEHLAINQPIRCRFDTRCRIPHGKTTWYHSWLGHPNERRGLLDIWTQQRQKGKRRPRAKIPTCANQNVYKILRCIIRNIINKEHLAESLTEIGSESGESGDSDIEILGVDRLSLLDEQLDEHPAQEPDTTTSSFPPPPPSITINGLKVPEQHINGL